MSSEELANSARDVVIAGILGLQEASQPAPEYVLGIAEDWALDGIVQDPCPETKSFSFSPVEFIYETQKEPTSEIVIPPPNGFRAAILVYSDRRYHDIRELGNVINTHEFRLEMNIRGNSFDVYRPAEASMVRTRETRELGQVVAANPVEIATVTATLRPTQ